MRAPPTTARPSSIAFMNICLLYKTGAINDKVKPGGSRGPEGLDPPAGHQRRLRSGGGAGAVRIGRALLAGACRAWSRSPSRRGEGPDVTLSAHAPLPGRFPTFGVWSLPVSR